MSILEIDQAKADAMIGKTVLVGISYCDAKGLITSNRQVFGTILRVNVDEGLIINSVVDGQEISLPPDLERYTAADPGLYLLKSADYTAKDPDYISTWKVHPPANGESGAA